MGTVTGVNYTYYYFDNVTLVYKHFRYLLFILDLFALALNENVFTTFLIEEYR